MGTPEERFGDGYVTPRVDDGRMPDVLTLWSLAVVAIGGAMLLVMSLSTRSSATSTAIACVDLTLLHAGVLEVASCIAAAASASVTGPPSAPST